MVFRLVGPSGFYIGSQEMSLEASGIVGCSLHGFIVGKQGRGEVESHRVVGFKFALE